MIKAGFILLTILMALLVFIGITNVASRTMTETGRLKRFRTRTALFLTGWLVYVTLLSFTGVFASLSLPPRIPLLLVLPAFTFMAYFFRSNRFTAIINATPASWLIYAQSFRIAVELMLAGMFMHGLLPKAATFEGYNYEIVIGITALLVGYFGYIRHSFSSTFILLWNVAGLCTLATVVFIIISYAYNPVMWPGADSHFIEHFGAFPYTLLAGFLMPLAVFMHIFSIVKIVRKTRQSGAIAGDLY